MLGWKIIVKRKTPDNLPPAERRKFFLAEWETGLGGVDWIGNLVKEGKAVNHGGNGYPILFTALAGVVLPVVAKGPPGKIEIPNFNENQKLSSDTLKINPQLIAQCKDGEEVEIEAWDLS